MIAEVGHFFLCLTFALSLCLLMVPIFHRLSPESKALQLVSPLTVFVTLFTTLSFLALAYGLVNHDFSIAYVANHSNSNLPLVYRLSALWGGHEGSLLLWVVLLSFWMLFVDLGSKRLPNPFKANMMAVLSIILMGFLAFIIFTSNPFSRFLPNYPLDGQDLNPLLQDFGLIIHPPMLYMGYVGLAVPFAFAISVLIEGKKEISKFSWLKPWVMAAWGFLTLGITIGSWWAYYELGWGGWWFWDPVENASFMPWLIGCALLHAIQVTSKNGALPAWTIFLAILGFCLSLIGTFLVRSGVLSSVHAFVNDPQRGLYILCFLSVVIGASLFLFAIRSQHLRTQHPLVFWSREGMMLSNNLLLTVACFTVLLGTLYPLMIDALFSQKVSVGSPYFNLVFIPIMLPMLVLMAIGMRLPWGQKIKSFKEMVSDFQLKVIVTAFLLTSVLLFSFANEVSYKVFLGVFLAVWIAVETGQMMVKRYRQVRSFKVLPWGMCLSHVGISILLVGISITSFYSVEQDVKLAPGEQIQISDYTISFERLDLVEGPNYVSHKGQFHIDKNHQHLTTLFPEKRVFVVQEMALSETAIYPGLLKDFYIALGEQLSEQAWSVRIYYKPFVRWIWLAGLWIALGAFYSAKRSWGQARRLDYA